MIAGSFGHAQHAKRVYTRPRTQPFLASVSNSMAGQNERGKLGDCVRGFLIRIWPVSGGCVDGMCGLASMAFFAQATIFSLGSQEVSKNPVRIALHRDISAVRS